jgi:hypothetical protein
MKNIVLALIVLAIATPASADVVISVSAGPGPNDVTISYDAGSEPNNVRAFGLEIVVHDPCVTIEDINCVNADYYVYPGSIEIDASGIVIDWGSCWCSGSYPGTPDEPNHKTIEMGSLYVGEANAPASSGDLAILTLGGCDDNGDVTIGVLENAIRGGIVMENPYEVVTVTSPGATLPTNLACCNCGTCWSPTECAGQPWCDCNCDGQCNLADLFCFKASFGAGAPWAGNQCCADFNHDQSVNLGDLFVLKAGFGSSGYVPSTGNQNCP